jgi:hypothetical protein
MSASQPRTNPLSREGASGPVHFWLRRCVDERRGVTVGASDPEH